jgi:hypothetical protein
MIATASVVRYSSVIGQSIALRDEEGLTIGQLHVTGVPPGMDYEAASRAIAHEVAALMEARNALGAVLRELRGWRPAASLTLEAALAWAEKAHAAAGGANA